MSYNPATMSHIQTAYDIGVQKALKEAGYASAEEVRKHAMELGIIQDEKQRDPLAGLLDNIGKR